MKSRFDATTRVPGNWEKQRLKPGTKLGMDVKDSGLVMFPTAHDLTPDFLPEAVATIRNLLAGGSRLLIVTKPHLPVIETLCREFAGDKEKILFRFTIGSLDTDLCAFWEPGAPPPAERIGALQHAFKAGYATSISAEPMLDSVERMVELVEALAPHVTDTIWIGKMQRVPVKLNAHVAGFSSAREMMRTQQTDVEILRLVELLQGNPKICWKDSISAVIQKHQNQN